MEDGVPETAHEHIDHEVVGEVAVVNEPTTEEAEEELTEERAVYDSERAVYDSERAID